MEHLWATDPSEWTSPKAGSKIKAVLASGKVAARKTEAWAVVRGNREEVDGILEMTSILVASEMTTSWEAGAGRVPETGEGALPPWEALAASERDLPCVDLPWTSESPQKRSAPNGPDCSSSPGRSRRPSTKSPTPILPSLAAPSPGRKSSKESRNEPEGLRASERRRSVPGKGGGGRWGGGGRKQAPGQRLLLLLLGCPRNISPCGHHSCHPTPLSSSKQKWVKQNKKKKENIKQNKPELVNACQLLTSGFILVRPWLCCI
nr:PREDICTED: eukaryotic translation initiation factor 4H isoform X1 [Anolis carolinensis]|eukprot:XP_016854060.1 PREDICTED: eukaryotic translation initiation factor 4H isoform X1 [Anolis carolinensis]